MALADLTDPHAVRLALAEFDQMGRDAFLKKYGFGRARSYFLIDGDHVYDSKAIAGAAHGFQHPGLGPLTAEVFSGGSATVRARLEALGFMVVVTEPRSDGPRVLELFGTYSRREVHDIFEPLTDFTAGAGRWGLAGIVEHHTGEFVLFVTLGKKEGQHQFEEGVTADGVVTWQSQPQQTLTDEQVVRLIHHDNEHGSVQLFLRTKYRAANGPEPYTYLGRLDYLTHDVERECPVHFQWQLIDTWPPPVEVLARMDLHFEATGVPPAVVPPPSTQTSAPLEEHGPPTVASPKGRKTAEFQARKGPDRSRVDARNRELGLAGERAVVEREQAWLTAQGRPDLASRVVHTSLHEGDGAGYDVRSFELNGSDRFIEVKTTQGGAETAFFISANELEFSVRRAEAYCLYRLYDFDRTIGRGKFYVLHGSVHQHALITLEPIQYRGRVAAPASE